MLKQRHTRQALGRICRLFGVTRQAYYQYYWHQEEISFEQALIVSEVIKIRKQHPRMGGRKLYHLLEPFLLEHQIKMGRDALFDLLADNELLVKRRKRRIHTTNSFHWLRKYPNLILSFTASRIHQLWVADITYWKVAGNPLYISLITDAYSRKIVGHQLWQTLEATGTIKALEKALTQLDGTIQYLIHHSDRGVQYCSKEYVALLERHDIHISMTQKGDPLENAIAERVNGILKEEYLLNQKVETLQQAEVLLDQAVRYYNQERPHMSLNYKTPQQVHQSNMPTQRVWKNYYSK